MKEKQNKIEFINNLANILAKKISPINTVNAINKLFKAYLNIEKLNIIIWDYNSFCLKDFADNFKQIGDEISEKSISYIYEILNSENGSKFLFNEICFNMDVNEEDLYNIKELIVEENNIVFPLVSNNEVFGLIQIRTKEQKQITSDYLSVLNIASKLISGAVINYILNEQMEVSLNFYKAMKDIAKIIESQYELSYIIPLIGEMIDRFITSHLIYIFIYKDNEYKLVWPNACKDKSIYKLLNKINEKTEYIVSENSKIGIFPIVNEEKILGAIAAYSNIENLLQKDIDYLVQLTRQSGMTIQRANMYAEVLKYATMDALTGLNNRRQFEIRLNQEIANSKRNSIPLCSMMLDVDYFKKVNDTYGHAAGDCVLKQVSDIIKSEIREYDIACRYGGEEFFIILPQTNIKEASLVAGRLRKVIEESKMDIKSLGIDGVSNIRVTVSIGVCEYNNSMSPALFSQKTDKALYKAKTTGRNRVIVS